MKSQRRKHLLMQQQICRPLSGTAFEYLWLLDSWLGRLSPATSVVPYTAHMWVEASVCTSEPTLTRIFRELCLSPDPVPLASWFRESPFSAAAMANSEQLVLPLSSFPCLADATPAARSTFLLSPDVNSRPLPTQLPGSYYWSTRFYRGDENDLPSLVYDWQILSRAAWRNHTVSQFTDGKTHF